MLDDNERKRLESAIRVNWIVWFFIFISLFVYVAVCHMLEKDIHGIVNIGDQLRTLTYAIVGVSVSVIVIIPIIRKAILQGTSERRLPTAPKSPESVYTTALVVSLALAESIGIYGFVLFILGSSYETLYVFIGVSALTMLLHRPRMEALEALATSLNEQAQRTSRMS